MSSGPSAEIAPAADVRTKLLCPVDTLREVGVMVTPFAAGTLDVALLTADGRLLGRRVVSAEELGGSQWIPVAPNPPVERCRGLELTVRLWSSGAPAVRGWLFPTYYSGITRQGGAVIPRRDLGLEFDGFAAGLLP